MIFNIVYVFCIYFLAVFCLWLYDGRGCAFKNFAEIGQGERECWGKIENGMHSFVLSKIGVSLRVSRK